jgi:hypothetical protein
MGMEELAENLRLLKAIAIGPFGLSTKGTREPLDRKTALIIKFPGLLDPETLEDEASGSCPGVYWLETKIRDWWLQRADDVGQL